MEALSYGAGECSRFGALAFMASLVLSLRISPRCSLALQTPTCPLFLTPTGTVFLTRKNARPSQGSRYKFLNLLTRQRSSWELHLLAHSFSKTLSGDLKWSGVFAVGLHKNTGRA